MENKKHISNYEAAQLLGCEKEYVNAVVMSEGEIFHLTEDEEKEIEKMLLEESKL